MGYLLEMAWIPGPARDDKHDGDWREGDRDVPLFFMEQDPQTPFPHSGSVGAPGGSEGSRIRVEHVS